MTVKWSGAGSPTLEHRRYATRSPGTYEAPARRAVIRVGALLAIASAPAGAIALASLTRARASELDAATWLPEDLVIVGICAVGAALCAYLTVIAVAMAIGTTRGALPRWSARLAPHTWRRVVALGIGVTLSSTAPAAIAAPPDAHPGWVTSESSYALVDALAAGTPDDSLAVSDQDGTVAQTSLPAQAEDPVAHAGWTTAGTGGTTQATAGAPTADALTAAAATAAPRDASAPLSWTVQSGDSLWSITSDHLAADATDAEIAEAWPLVYEANRAVIGDDPGLIHPGQVLTIPVEVAR